MVEQSDRSQQSMMLEGYRNNARSLRLSNEANNTGSAFHDMTVEYMDHVDNLSHRPFGLWMPLSNILEDLYRPGFPPSAERMHPIALGILEAVHKSGGSVSVRGSTLPYAANKLEGIERRGTLSMAVQTVLSPAIEKYPHLKSLQALARLQNHSDFDLMIDGIDIDHFDKLNEQIRNAIDGEFRDPFTPVGESFVSRKRLESLDEKGPVRITHEDGLIGEIPYGEVHATTKEGQHLFTGFWTPRILPDGIYDIRRDPKYALSWDARVTGHLVSDLPADVAPVARVAIEKKTLMKKPHEKRLIHESGVFPLADFVRGRDLWLHIPNEDMDVLGKPIEVGRQFRELPIVEKFKLAVRAAQKGALAEENLRLTEDGRLNRAAQFGVGAALSYDAKAAFHQISVDEFGDAMKSLSAGEFEELRKELMESMMMGFFYPARFIEYGLAADIFKFFPLLRNITYDEWLEVSRTLPGHEEYLRTQYISTHFWEADETEILIASDKDVEVQKARYYNSFQNPYHLLVKAIAKVAPGKIPDTENPFEVLDILFDLEAHEFAPKQGEEVEDISSKQGKYYGLDYQQKAEIRLKREYEIQIERNKRTWKSNALNFTPVVAYAVGSAVNQFFEVPGLDALGFITKFPYGLLNAIPLSAWTVYNIRKKDREIREIEKSSKLTQYEIDQSKKPRG